MHKSIDDITDGYLDIAYRTRCIVQTILEMQCCDSESHTKLMNAAKQLSQAMDLFVGEWIVSFTKSRRDIEVQLNKDNKDS